MSFFVRTRLLRLCSAVCGSARGSLVLRPFMAMVFLPAALTIERLFREDTDMRTQFVLFAAISIFLFAAGAAAEDLNENFKKVSEYTAAGNYPKALEELDWARKEIEKLHLKKLSSILPDNVAGFSGQPAKTQAAMGITTIEKTYTGKGQKVQVSLTGSTGRSAGGFGGLAAMGQMAAMMGGTGTGTDTVRISGRTAMLESEEGSNRAELTVFMDGGLVLKLENQQSNDTQALRAIAEGLKLDEIESYLKGSAR